MGCLDLHFIGNKARFTRQRAKGPLIENVQAALFQLCSRYRNRISQYCTNSKAYMVQKCSSFFDNPYKRLWRV